MTFSAGLKTLQRLSKEQIPRTVVLKQALYRMIYASAITLLETFLSDAFYQIVISDERLITRLIQTAPQFSERKYTLADAIDWHQNQKQKLTEYLFDIAWHNLSRIGAMYKAVLHVGLPEDSEAIYKAIAVRHDIVHRNGRTKGGKLHCLREGDLERLLINLDSFVREVATGLDTRSTKDPPD